MLECTKVMLQMVIRIFGKDFFFFGKRMLVNLGVHLQMLWNRFLSRCSDNKDIASSHLDPI